LPAINSEETIIEGFRLNYLTILTLIIDCEDLNSMHSFWNSRKDNPNGKILELWAESNGILFKPSLNPHITQLEAPLRS
jgi:hypothetical protein